MDNIEDTSIEYRSRLINRSLNNSLMKDDAAIPKSREATDPDEIAKLRADRLPQLMKLAGDVVRLLGLPRPEYKSERKQLKYDIGYAKNRLKDELEWFEHPTRPYTLLDYATEHGGDSRQGLIDWLSSGNSMFQGIPLVQDKEEDDGDRA